MPEMLTPTSAIMGAGLGSDVALLTDGRFSGGSHGFIVGHITPEAQTAGRSRWSKPATRSSSTPKPTPSTLIVYRRRHGSSRREAWNAPAFKSTRGTLYKYIKNVKSASEGCVTDE